jgi:hypothetical protein
MSWTFRLADRGASLHCQSLQACRRTAWIRLTTHADVNTEDQALRIAQSGLGPNSLTIGDQRAIPSATAISIGRVHLP